MAYRYVSNTYKIIADNEIGTSNAVRFALADIKRIAEPKTPKDTGDLRGTTLITTQGKVGSITWTRRYAAAQEAGYTRGHRIQNYTTAGTGPHYGRDAVETVVKNFKQYLVKARIV